MELGAFEKILPILYMFSSVVHLESVQVVWIRPFHPY